MNEVARAVGRAHAVRDLDLEAAVVHRSEVEVDLGDLDPRLPPAQRGANRSVDSADHRGVDGVEGEVVDLAAEFGPHRPLPWGRAEDQLDRLRDVVFPA